MEIIVKGRNAEISDRFRSHVEEKLTKIEQFAPRAQRVEVEVTHEPNRAQAEESEKIEITVRDKGPVVRAEATSSDRYGALDLATTKLLERMRRAHDRRKDRRRKGPDNGVPQDLELDVDALKDEVAASKASEEYGTDEPSAPTERGVAVESQLGDSPVIVRQKLHEATPMSVDQALYEMELVGHPFYLFIEEDTKQPCVVYHRHGWTYGVIRLDTVTH